MFLGVAGCSNGVRQLDFHFDVPQVSELEQKVSSFSPETGSSEELLRQADYGKRVHGSLLSFVENSTFHSIDWWGYHFEHQESVEPWEVERLRTRAREIKPNDDYTLRQCAAAAEKLYDIMEKADKEGHLDQAAQVIGYLDRVSLKTRSIFSGFGFFYEHNSRTTSPTAILRWYALDASEVREMESRARALFNSLSDDVRDELTQWVGRYGHDALRRARVFSDVPAAPASGQDTFYRQFGEHLLKKYGLVTNS